MNIQPTSSDVRNLFKEMGSTDLERECANDPMKEKVLELNRVFIETLLASDLPERIESANQLRNEAAENIDPLRECAQSLGWDKVAELIQKLGLNPAKVPAAGTRMMGKEFFRAFLPLDGREFTSHAAKVAQGLVEIGKGLVGYAGKRWSETKKTPPPVKPLVGHFYKIKTQEGKTCGYLMGSIHYMRPDMMDLNPKIHKAIKKCNRLFLEAFGDKDKLSDAVVNQTIQQYNIRNAEAEQAVQKYLSIFQTEGRDRELKCQNLPPLEALKLCFEKYYQLCLEKRGCLDANKTSIQGIDHLLDTIFSRSGKTIDGLMSMEDHIKVMPEDVLLIQRAEFLNPDLSRDTKIPIMVDIICDIWRDGEAFASKTAVTSAALDASEDRSLAFTESILKDLSQGQGRGMYCPGASHLYDRKGIVQGLQASGYIVQRVYP